MGGYFFAAIAHSPSHFRPSENDSLLIYARMPGVKNGKSRKPQVEYDIEQQSLVLPFQFVFALRKKI